MQVLHVWEGVVRSREWGQNGHSLHRCSRKVAAGKHMTLMSSVSPAEAWKPGQHRGSVDYGPGESMSIVLGCCPGTYSS